MIPYTIYTITHLYIVYIPMKVFTFIYIKFNISGFFLRSINKNINKYYIKRCFYNNCQWQFVILVYRIYNNEAIF